MSFAFDLAICCRSRAWTTAEGWTERLVGAEPDRDQQIILVEPCKDRLWVVDSSRLKRHVEDEKPSGRSSLEQVSFAAF